MPLSRHRTFSSPSTGFTLVELSIVLVILGLLAGGIMLGKSLIRSAQLRSVISDVNNFEQAVLGFQKKYKSLPGDMPDATTYWGMDPNGCPASYNTVRKTATCNGTGDGIIVGTAGWAPYELFRAWQHLSNAGMIDGKFTGAQGASANTQTVVGLNVPQSRIEAAGYSLLSLGSASNVGSGDANMFAGQYDHIIMFGAPYLTEYTRGPAIAPSDAWDIDTKMDDGKPATGIVVTHKSTSGYSPGCATSALTTATYAVTSYGNLCSLLFKMPF